MLKRIVLFILLSGIDISLSAQTATFSYDNAGNRTGRQVHFGSLLPVAVLSSSLQIIVFSIILIMVICFRFDYELSST